MIDIINEIKQVFICETEALYAMQTDISDSFIMFVNEICDCSGRIILTGMGKSGHICRKIAATMQSVGIKAYFMHPSEGLHGDLGILSSDDLLIAVSNSGETDEVLSILPTVKKIGARIMCIVGRPNSTLQKYALAAIIIPPIKEAFLNQLVPTSSTTVTLVIGDALAIAAAKLRGFTANDFGVYHPNGLLGRRLTLTVDELMIKGDENALVYSGSTIQDAIFEMCRASIGGVCVIDSKKKLLGIFTDGDLRRLCNRYGNTAMNVIIDDVMTCNPLTYPSDILVSDLIMESKRLGKFVSFFPIVDHEQLVGALRLIDITNSGLLG